ncbi:hypothetical protein [Streptomyces sp. NPDC006193]|uniref:hypothetical protein n=1 Tax=Streptomyces sp. NPDC006193 TaxID=3155717 RepID=UPI0033B681D2
MSDLVKGGNAVTRRVVAATGVIALFGLLAGCSEPVAKKDYAVPRTLCDVPLDPDLLSPFLPAGKRVDVRESRPVPSRKICRVEVDGKWALMANLQWWEEDVDISAVVSANPQTDKSPQSTGDHFFYTGSGAVKLVEGCKNREHSRHLLYTSVLLNNPDLGDTTAMKKLATAFTSAVGESDECS